MCGLTVALEPVWAGPPFVSDDPEPTASGHWEIYNFVSGTRVSGRETGQAGTDINYGASDDLQLTAVVPVDYLSGSGKNLGSGDVELAFKLRFLHQSENGWMPDVAFFPRLFLPTGNRRFESGHESVFLPLWLQKDSGPWSYFGGGGYQISAGAGQRNFRLFGAAAERKLTDQLLIGAEIYSETGTADLRKPYAALNAGATYQISDHLAYLISVGPGLQNASQLGRFNFYTALDVTW